MAVLLPNCLLGVRRRTAGLTGSHGDQTRFSWAPLVGPWPGRAEEGPDVPAGQIAGRTWVLAVDPQAWPLTQGDLVVDSDADRTWLITSADLLQHNRDPSINYVRVEAHLRTTGTKP
jgi:hypothetical protein